jgi:hypothetical protein
LFFFVKPLKNGFAKSCLYNRLKSPSKGRINAAFVNYSDASQPFFIAPNEFGFLFHFRVRVQFQFQEGRMNSASINYNVALRRSFIEPNEFGIPDIEPISF